MLIKLGFVTDLKRSLSASTLNEVKLFLSLLIWIADCTQFQSNVKLLDGSVFKNEYEPMFGSLHTLLTAAHHHTAAAVDKYAQSEINTS